MHNNERAPVRLELPKGAIKLIPVDNVGSEIALRAQVDLADFDLKGASSFAARLGHASVHRQPIQPGVETVRIADGRRIVRTASARGQVMAGGNVPCLTDPAGNSGLYIAGVNSNIEAAAIGNPADELRRLVNSYQVTQAIHVIVELGIPDLLADEARSAADLALAADANEDALYRVLRALAAIGVLVELADRRFELGPIGELLRRDDPRSLAPWAAFAGSQAHWQAWSNLSHSVRTGETAFRFTHGVDVWEHRREHPEEGKLFDKAMTAQTRWIDTAVVNAYDFGKYPVVADIGGGHGALLAAILRQIRR